MLLYKAKKGTKKTNQKKEQEKKIVGALIAYVYWVSLALVKMRIIRHNQNKKKKKKWFLSSALELQIWRIHFKQNVFCVYQNLNQIPQFFLECILCIRI